PAGRRRGAGLAGPGTSQPVRGRAHRQPARPAPRHTPTRARPPRGTPVPVHRPRPRGGIPGHLPQVPAPRTPAQQPGPARCRTALANHRFLSALDTVARVPPLIATSPHTLTFASAPGRHAEPRDLIRLAACLGDLHGAAYTTELHAADVGRPFTTRDGLLPD